MIKIYLASGWFSENTERSLTDLEDTLKLFNSSIITYSPRRDGVKLTPNEFHDHRLRKKVFLDNVENINSADYILVNLDSSDGFYDTGTCWELGYAMAHGINVIAYDPLNNLKRFSGISSGFCAVCSKIVDVRDILNFITSTPMSNQRITDTSRNPAGNHKLLFVGPEDTEKHLEDNTNIIANVILESHGENFRSIHVDHSELYDKMEDIFKDVDYMVAVIDDRNPIVSWMMGQAYEREIPIVSYTNYDYGVNLMLGVSVITHCKGKEELKATIQKVKREGLRSFSEYDTSAMKVY